MYNSIIKFKSCETITSIASTRQIYRTHFTSNFITKIVLLLFGEYSDYFVNFISVLNILS